MGDFERANMIDIDDDDIANEVANLTQEQKLKNWLRKNKNRKDDRSSSPKSTSPKGKGRLSPKLTNIIRIEENPTQERLPSPRVIPPVIRDKTFKAQKHI